MRRAAFAILFLSLLTISLVSGETEQGQGSNPGISRPEAIVSAFASEASRGGSLRFLAQARGIQIGTAVAMRPLRSDTHYTEALRREFNILTPANAMKFGPVHPSPGRYTFGDADAVVAFAKAHDMKVRGHTLVWHSNLPHWVSEGNFTRDQLMAILREHILTVVRHFRGQVIAWDVVNEAVERDGSLRSTIWLRGIGPDYIDLAFRWAHEADPRARLFYNDYGGEGLGRKSDTIYTLVRGLLQRGVPIHGVGLQMHIVLGSSPKPQDVAVNMQRLAALGLEVHVTEMDVKMQNDTGTTEEQLVAQAELYRDMLRVCLSATNCKSFVMWGFTDRYPRPNAPLIFDASYRPKPAYYALRDALIGR